MYGRVAKYGYDGDAHDIARLAEEGVLPIFEADPGFKAYVLLESDGEIISFSSWDSAATAEAANDLAARWIAENMAEDVELKELHIGEILSTTLAVGPKSAAGA